MFLPAVLISLTATLITLPLFVDIRISSPSLIGNEDVMFPFLGELTIPIIPFPPLLVTRYSVCNVFLPKPFSVIDSINFSLAFNSDFSSFVFFPLLILIVGCQQIEVYQENPSELNDIDIGIEENVIEISTTQPYQDVWDFIKQNNTSQNTNILNDQVLAYMNMHLKDLDKFDEYLNDSYYFLYFVIQELEKNNLPLELAILPYIESNYDPFSISSSGAVGIWQFMPRTGRLYQLDKSWWNEDRHDPFRSTEAAVKYLKYLYQRFDQNIYHTLSAYNAGPSLLDRRINQNKRRGMDTDFWSLNVPVQTKNYVPKYIALRELILNSDNYGIKLPQIPYEPVVKKISIPGQVEVLTLSEYLDIKPELLYKLNAGYTKWASAPEDESVFYIPSEKYILFENEDNPFKNSNQINWISHIVQSGDSLWSLSSKYDTEVRIIKKIVSDLIFHRKTSYCHRISDTFVRNS